MHRSTRDRCGEDRHATAPRLPGIWGLFALHGEQQLTAAFTTAFGLMILWILFGTERTDQLFEQD